VKRGRRIVMWSFRALPSFRMRGRQVGEVLRARGHAVEFRTGFGFIVLRDVRDAIVVLVKDQPSQLPALARRGNRVVFDVVDFEPDQHRLGPVDAIVCGSEHVRARMARRFPSTPAVVVYHHADPRLVPHRAGADRLRLASSGEKKNSRFLGGEIPELQVVSFRKDAWPERMQGYNAHFSARLDPCKSVVKLANAAALGAVYLTGAEPGCLELLGPDYPFYLRDPASLNAVREDVGRLRQEVGSPAWVRSHDLLRSLRSRLTVEATATAYQRLFDQLA
jgi:hypothetical protein